jgi:hypothetical protein
MPCVFVGEARLHARCFGYFALGKGLGRLFLVGLESVWFSLSLFCYGICVAVREMILFLVSEPL